MRSIHVSVDVPQARDAAYEYLDVLANHEQFTDHMMRNWRTHGPPRGVGAQATVEVVLAGRSEPVDIEVIEVDAPRRSVERNTGAGGKRIATGTYVLEQLADGQTRITFEYAVEQTPFSERLAAPIIRRITQKALQTAMQRLAEQLNTRRLQPNPAA